MANNNVNPGVDLTDLITTNQNLVRVMAQILNVLQTTFPQISGTSTTASAGGATLPADPEGFISTVHPSTGDTIMVPYYLP